MLNTITIDMLSAIGGALLTAIGVMAKNALSQRTKIDETVMKERRELYKKLWEKTKLLPKWPQATNVTYAKLLTLSEELRDWYLLEGGIYLSEQARKAYGNVQENLCLTAQGKWDDQTKTITDTEYKTLVVFCSALRTELTRDLQSRKRAFWNVN
jgi:hypothetical protein